LTDPSIWDIEVDMAKKQSRRSISVSRTTYERLKSYCETSGISMSQFVETRVGDFLGRSRLREDRPAAAAVPSAPQAGEVVQAAPAPRPAPAPGPVVRAERRPAPPPAKPTADQIFTF
jgi:hypothetical protein